MTCVNWKLLSKGNHCCSSQSYWSDKTSSTDRPTGAKEYVPSFSKEGINIDDKANLPKIPVNNLIERSTVQRYDDIKNNWVNNSEYSIMSQIIEKKAFCTWRNIRLFLETYFMKTIRLVDECTRVQKALNKLITKILNSNLIMPLWYWKLNITLSIFVF